MHIVLHENIKKKFNEKDLPFVFNEHYREFIESYPHNEYLLFYSEQQQSLMPVKKFRSRGFPLLQLLHPPVSVTGESLNEEDEETFLDDFIKHVRSRKIGIRIIQPPAYAIFKTAPNDSRYCSFGSYCLDLKQPEDTLLQQLHPKHRNVIRNGEKHGVIIKWGEECLHDFYTLFSQTMKRSAMYGENYEYFENEMKRLGEENVLCGVAYAPPSPENEEKEVPLGGLWLAYTLFGAYYLFGASTAHVTVTGAINYLHWEAIKYLKKKGVKRYDFVGFRLGNVSGTKPEGIQMFKKRFGGKLLKGYLWKMDIDKHYCRMYDSLLKMKLKWNGANLPLDIIDQERIKMVIT